MHTTHLVVTSQRKPTQLAWKSHMQVSNNSDVHYLYCIFGALYRICITASCSNCLLVPTTLLIVWCWMTMAPIPTAMAASGYGLWLLDGTLQIKPAVVIFMYILQVLGSSLNEWNIFWNNFFFNHSTVSKAVGGSFFKRHPCKTGLNQIIHAAQEI